ncbi:hypothetical protein ABZ349_12545 [Streptomyces niveus]|uniref:hypothetical protein n=1 Tax=Streptomyces niveus TaxID=193462 RepID=UPI0033D6E4AA
MNHHRYQPCSHPPRKASSHAQHQLRVEVEVEDETSLALVAHDSGNLHAAAQLSAILGADSISERMKLHRPRGMRKLAAWMGLLLTGALGRGRGVLAEPGCAHAEDKLLIDLSVEQGLRLAGTIAAEPARPDQEEEDAACVGEAS